MRSAGSRFVVVVVAASVLAGCGGGGSTGAKDAAKVKQTMRREFTAVANGDGATACSLATPAGQARLASAVAGATCPQVIKLVAQRLPVGVRAALLSAKVSRVTVHGNRATVQDADIHTSHGGLTGFLQPGSAPTVLTKQPDGSWKISS